MLKTWSEKAWDDYLWWQENDKAGLKRINRLIKEIERAGAVGKPPAKAERLRFSSHGLCSVRIDRANRLVYKVEDEKHLSIVSVRGHYQG